MTTYLTSLASAFDGFRIDNCHSTPLHVGVAMLDTARVANLDLYVYAELFTGSEATDTLFASGSASARSFARLVTPETQRSFPALVTATGSGNRLVRHVRRGRAACVLTPAVQAR
jgi:hypothetical protein